MSAKLPWREHLTAEEKITISLADGAKIKWQQLNRERAAITNRAIQRAKYAAKQAVDPSDIVAQLRNARMMVNYGNGDVRDEPDPLHEAAAAEIERLRRSNPPPSP